MRTALHIVFVVLGSMVAAACYSADLTICPEVDCPSEKVCDGHGGCAFPEQLDVCKGRADGDGCTYRDPTGTEVGGQCAGEVCLPVGCGNKAVTPDEVCDDGNNVSGDGCAADCRSDETCGNGTVDTAAGEQCDDSNLVDGDACQSTCKQPRCGDNVKDVGLDEACDLGDANSMVPDAACRPNCQLPRCGDTVIDIAKGEKCDDGNNQAGDGCAGDCASTEVCGNGVVDGLTGEVCDDGNTASGDGCAANCKSLEVCGNGVTDVVRGEVCDDNNTVSGDGCSSDCKSLEVCGNEIVDTVTEQCDLGDQNSNAPNSPCRTNCKLRICGDTIIDPLYGEQCDNGLANADAPNTCRTNCQNPRCGDTIKDSGEVCDDGNTISGDGCSANCASLETCGNTIVDVAKGEECDAGGANSNDPNAACRVGCKLPKCGDGVTDNQRGEVCDAGTNNSNAPDATCRPTCVPPTCGDAVVDPLRGEKCDDGNIVSGDGCRSDCNSNETCGNGVVDPQNGELCDDGNTRGYDGCSACMPENIVVLSPGGAPPARELHVLAYDGARQRAVMFGGKDGSTELDDTWQWDGAGWTKLVPMHSPAPRYGAAAAYDAKRNRIVMFGGTTANGVSGDTWEFDGVDWVQKNPTMSPGARSGAAMAFDANRGRVIMFGGTNGTPNQETWEWTGTTWNLLNPTFKPSARVGARMAFDSTNKYVVMFGGSGGDTHTYTFDSTGNWTDRGSTTGPTTGADAIGMTFDANRGKVVVWGGTANTYEWSGSAWTSIAGGATTPRASVAMTYDAARQQVVLFGGVNGGTPYADTWLRSSTTWSQPPPFAKPSARMRSMSSYDPLSKRVVLFGGQLLSRRVSGCKDVVGCNGTDTWEWDGRKWQSVAATTPPGMRAGAVMDYDPNARVMRLYGGDHLEGDANGCRRTFKYQDVYRYNGSAWTRETNSTSGHDNSRMAAAAFDVSANRFVTFGGLVQDSCSQYGQTVATTHYWHSSTGWTNASPANSPGDRLNSAMAYDRVRNRSVLYSGMSGVGVATDDTWLWNNTTWTKVTTTSAPNPRTSHNMFYNPDAGRVVVFGSSGYQTGEDVWEFDGANWQRRDQIGTHATTSYPTTSYDAANHTIVTFGGRGGTLSSFATDAFSLLQSRPNAAAEVCTGKNLDYDNDGKAGCADDECWSVCDPLHPPGTSRPAGAPYCGDGLCNGAENCANCGDCAVCTGTCGNFNCDSGETATSCPNDC